MWYDIVSHTRIDQEIDEFSVLSTCPCVLLTCSSLFTHTSSSSAHFPTYSRQPPTTNGQSVWRMKCIDHATSFHRELTSKNDVLIYQHVSLIISFWYLIRAFLCWVKWQWRSAHLTHTHTHLSSSIRLHQDVRFDFVQLTLASCTYQLYVPRTRTILGERAFAIAGPRAWNSLPVMVRSAPSQSTFKSHLKTFLFRCAFNTSVTYWLFIHWYIFYLYLYYVFVVVLILLPINRNKNVCPYTIIYCYRSPPQRNTPSCGHNSTSSVSCNGLCSISPSARTSGWENHRRHRQSHRNTF